MHTYRHINANPTEYNSTIKRNEALTHALTCKNFADIMLSKRSQIQKTTYCVVLFIVQNTQNRENYGACNLISGYLGQGMGKLG
jgi:hypothetical protein